MNGYCFRSSDTPCAPRLQARMNIPGAEALVGKADSSNPEFTEKWEQLGNSYHQLGLKPQAACEAALTRKFSR